MSFAVVFGNSYSIKNDLKERFKMSFDFDRKVWYKNIPNDKYWWWRQTIESLSDEVTLCWVKDLSQVANARKVLAEEESAEPKAHELDGSILEMSAWYARTFKESNNTAYSFRNFKVLRVLRETERALQIDMEFFAGIACTCGVCGRQLDNAISKATGIGPVCAEKIGLPRPTMETAKAIVAELENLSSKQGQFLGVWVPKSQIKRTVKNGSVEENKKEEV